MGRRNRSIIICGLLALLLCACGNNLPENGWWSEGRYLRGKNADLIIFEGTYGSACTMSAADETVSFEELEDGDLIRIYVNWLGLTWPEQTVVYAVEKLEDGAPGDIPQDQLEQLREYGYLEDEHDLPAEGSWETGRYLRGKQDLIIIGNWGATAMRAADETVSFEPFEDGDVIRIYIDYILETWPGQTTVYAVEKAEDEDIQEISPELMKELRDMGWIE